MKDEAATVKIYRHNGRAFQKAPECVPYDFGQPYTLNKEDQGTLQEHMQRGARATAGRLALMLRMDCKATVKDLQTQTYADYIKSLAEPACLGVFQASGLSGLGLIAAPTRLALGCVNRLVGGSGAFEKESRPLSAVEQAIWEDPLGVFLEEWGKQWQPLGAWPPQLLGQEHFGQFLSLALPHTGVLVTNLEVEIGENTDTVQWAVPYPMLAPILKKLYALRKHYEELREPTTRYHWTSSYEGIHVPLTARWQPKPMTLRAFLSLKPGSLIELPPEQLKKTQLAIKDTPRFVGEVGLEGKHIAVKLTQSV